MFVSEYAVVTVVDLGLVPSGTLALTILVTDALPGPVGFLTVATARTFQYLSAAVQVKTPDHSTDPSVLVVVRGVVSSVAYCAHAGSTQLGSVGGSFASAKITATALLIPSSASAYAFWSAALSVAWRAPELVRAIDVAKPSERTSRIPRAITSATPRSSRRRARKTDICDRSMNESLRIGWWGDTPKRGKIDARSGGPASPARGYRFESTGAACG